MKDKPAFPGVELPEHPNFPMGLTIRQYYAAKAMQALIGVNYPINPKTGQVQDVIYDYTDLAREANIYADEMIKFEQDES